jgi:hypothetical protein
MQHDELEAGGHFIDYGIFPDIYQIPTMTGPQVPPNRTLKRLTVPPYRLHDPLNIRTNEPPNAQISARSIYYSELKNPARVEKLCHGTTV